MANMKGIKGENERKLGELAESQIHLLFFSVERMFLVMERYADILRYRDFDCELFPVELLLLFFIFAIVSSSANA